MEEQRPSTYGAGRTALVAVGACTLLVALLVTWAATVGPGRVLEGDGPLRDALDRPPATSDSPSATVEVDDQDRPPAGSERGAPRILQLGLVLLLLVAGVVAPVFFVLALRRLPQRQARGEPDEERDHVDFDPLGPDPQAAREALADDSAHRRATLLEGDARNAIVRCWQEFETGAAAAGVRRERWETSSEHAQRVLRLVGADERAVAELAAIFREARYSRHEVGEEVRARAVALLDQIHRTMARSGAGS